MKERPKDLAFYEWRFTAWRTSATRDMLDAAGRGIYRELLDQCYAQGEFPNDPTYICRVCACSMEEFERAWKVIAKHFYKAKNGALKNKFADLSRRQYAEYVESQRKRRKTAAEKSKQNNNIDKLASTSDDSRTDLTRTRTRTIQGQEQGSAVATNAQPQLVEALPFAMTENESGYWAELWYQRHPKKRDFVLVHKPAARLFEQGGVELMRTIDGIHKQKCVSEDWLRDGGRYVPTLSKWLEDRGWTENVAAAVPEQPKTKIWRLEDHL